MPFQRQLSRPSRLWRRPFPPIAGAASGWLQHVGSGTRSTSGTTIAITPTQNAFVGDTLVVALKCASGVGAVSCADNSGDGNTYTNRFDSGSASASLRLVVFVADNIGSHLTTSSSITVTFPTVALAAANIEEYSGLPTSSFEQASAEAHGTSTTPTTNSVTTLQTTEVGIGVFAWSTTSNNLTVGTVGGGTATASATSLRGTAGSISTGWVGMEDATFSTIGTAVATGTFGSSIAWECAIIILKIGTPVSKAFASNVTPSSVFHGAKVLPRSFSSTVTPSSSFTKVTHFFRSFTSQPATSSHFGRAGVVKIKANVQSIVAKTLLSIRGVLGG